MGAAEQKTLICVTNKPEQPARSIVEALGMNQYFVDVIGGDRFEERKPHPKATFVLCRTLWFAERANSNDW